MAQKIIVFEGEYNKDILTDDRVAGLIAKGYAIKMVSAATVPNRKPTCYLLMENAAGGGETVDSTSVEFDGQWPDNFQWLYDVSPRTLDNILYRISAVINTMLQQVQGKLATGSFYASTGTNTYSDSAETPSASKLYIDVNDGNKLYRYDTGTSAYVRIGASVPASS